MVNFAGLSNNNYLISYNAPAITYNAERRELIREDLVISALPVEGGGFHGVVIPQQTVATDQVMVAGVICRHRHGDLTSALTCANELANAAKSS